MNNMKLKRLFFNHQSRLSMIYIEKDLLKDNDLIFVPCLNVHDKYESLSDRII